MGKIHVLEIVRGPRAGETAVIDPTRGLVVGRSSDADLRLPEDGVSRKHARFYCRRGYTWVADVGSRAGVWVGGRRVERHRLLAGDHVAIGAHVMRVEVREESRITHGRAGGLADRVGGPSEDTGSGRSMRGSLEDIPLMDVLQWLATSRKTGTLNVHGEDGERNGRLCLRDGQVFHAVIEGRENVHPEKALLRMMRWKKGIFELDPEVIEAEETIEASLEHMLMEAARQEDELSVLTSKHELPADEDELSIVAEAKVRWKDLEPAELDLLQDVYRFRTWREILDRTEASDLEATRTLVKLAKAGLVAWS